MLGCRQGKGTLALSGQFMALINLIERLLVVSLKRLVHPMLTSDLILIGTLRYLVQMGLFLDLSRKCPYL